MPWRYDDLLLDLDRRSERRMHFGLERMHAACARLQHPELAVPTLHIAGTNGKGSTAAFLAALLRDAGYRVGVYTSPHLCDYAERFTLDGVPAAHAALAACAETTVQLTADLSLTYFEFSTLLAFRYFAATRPDVVIVETGLGGRLDATNVVDPVLVLLSPIAIDHAEYLGRDVAAIAAEKCGIMKAGRPVISAVQLPEVSAVVEESARALGCPLQWAEPIAASVPLGLAGAHQRINAGLAWAAAQALRDLGWRRGRVASLAEAHWPGRCEWWSRHPAVLFDGAHNPAGVAALVAYLRRIADGRDVGVCFGALADKPVTEMLDLLAPLATRWIAVTPPSARALAAADVAAQLRRCQAFVTESALAAVPQLVAAAPDLLWVLTGSLTLYAPLRAAFGTGNFAGTSEGGAPLRGTLG
ncbi:MAG: bifunctional folylpolyglutamate synthase/dihydrofolate synthase [Deltaproteobacteria bacterium]|nr:bifunctional folylpolyglutamate synthase/dihydrofolate synthase [Deltaproteobacteria bacterium]